MCLYSVSKTKSIKNGTGYKVFQLKEGGLYGWFMGNITLPYPKKKWVHEKAYRDCCSFEYLQADREKLAENGYKTGFHIFKLRKDAMLWKTVKTDIVCKVQYRKVVATGQQVHNSNPLKPYTTKPVVVAKEIRVL